MTQGAGLEKLTGALGSTHSAGRLAKSCGRIGVASQNWLILVKQITGPVLLHPMKIGRLPSWPAVVLGLLALVPGAFATTVIAPAFDDLIGQADYIVRAVVKSVTSEWRDNPDQPGHKYIATMVELDVKEVIMGTPPSPLVLDLVGGRIGNKNLTIEGAPKFVVGQESILFVKGNGLQIVPLVGMIHGFYPVKRDKAGGPARMMSGNGRLLFSEKEIGQADSTAPAVSPDATSQPLSPEDFAARIRNSPKFHNREDPR